MSLIYNFFTFNWKKLNNRIKYTNINFHSGLIAFDSFKSIVIMNVEN